MQGYITKILVVVLQIIIGIWLEVAGMLDAEKILAMAREYSQHWWLVVILILLQGLLFTFALAGSLFLWVAAPLYSPVMATFILAAGGTLGGLGAYFFSEFLVEDWTQKIEKSHTYRILHKQDNFFTLFAMRVFPAFPHSLVNYSSGVLKVNLVHFVLAAVLGISIKSYIYARVIHDATTLTPRELLNVATLAPLIVLSAISLAAVFIKYRLNRNH
jgi:uncharacterized membrane protein YdjX (TVP38/TMEM64 family)